MNKQTFHFGGFHFEPFRDITKKEEANYYKALGIRSDSELNLTKESNNYSHQRLYDAATNRVDLYICIETGKIYIPCECELFWCAGIKNNKKN